MAWSSPYWKSTLKRAPTFVVLLLLIILPAESIQAAATKGIIVSPAYQQIDISASQASQIITVDYTNRGTIDQTFRLSTADFGSLDDSGGVAFLGQPANELEHRYGLTSWMQLSTDTLFLAAGTTRRLTATIQNRVSLSPGGHYGVILATSVGDPSRPGESGADIGVKQVLTSLILLTKDGGSNPELKLVSQSLDGNIGKLPSRAELHFQNTGNVHVVPRGTIDIKDPFGRVVERTALNEESGVILPESFRKMGSSFMPIAQAWWPGRYAAVTNYRYDGTDTLTTVTTHFWYAGMVIVWFLISVFCIFLAIIIWGLIRRRKKSR
jgi:hypothetical protein